MKSAVLFVAAEARECTPWVSRWENSQRANLPVHWGRTGWWKGRQVVAVANGAGWERAYQAARSVPAASALCSIGFCGALDQRLSVGDVVRVSEVRSERGRIVTAGADHDSSREVLVSVDHIVASVEEKRALRGNGASVVEMEAAGVARAAQELNLPFYCIRAVSDRADEGFLNDFGAALRGDGSISVAKLLAGAMRDPVRRFGELIRLSRRTALASRNLGDFLANCEF